MGGEGSGRKPGMGSMFDAPKQNVQFNEGQKSKGILDDFAERQNVDTAEGTIQKTPVNSKDITNKAYVDTVAAGFLSNIVEDTTPELGGEMDCGAHTIGFTQQSATGDGTTTIDWKLGNKFYFTFGAQADTFTFTAPSNPCNLILILKQDGTGSRIPTFPASVLWSGGSMPTFTTGANAVDIVAFYYDGTNYFGVETLDFS